WSLLLLSDGVIISSVTPSTRFSWFKKIVRWVLLFSGFNHQCNFSDLEEKYVIMI
ncbi:hypothetical protein L9F63_020453, partial [Diploptera punctata]